MSQVNIPQLESDMFDIIVGLNQQLQYKQREKYKLYLVALEQLNHEYKQNTGKFYIDTSITLRYYEKLWES